MWDTLYPRQVPNLQGTVGGRYEGDQREVATGQRKKDTLIRDVEGWLGEQNQWPGYTAWPVSRLGQHYLNVRRGSPV